MKSEGESVDVVITREGYHDRADVVGKYCDMSNLEVTLISRHVMVLKIVRYGKRKKD